jgi:NAD(P)-dependent dehydrogenase (short-subunit alcohol dehydrogenase family)
MGIKLKRLEDQVLVITGGTSGIGLATATRAAERGARVVLCSWNEPELRETVSTIEACGGTARSVVADVTRPEDLERLASTAIEEFGTIDTWVNNAGVSIYGALTEVAIEDMRRLFEVNFWGTVYGARAAVARLRGNGGVLINIGSIVSDRAIPLQGTYSVSKHAVKGFTDALRVELEEEGAPISVTLIKPSTIDTPYFQHAKNYLAVEPELPAPAFGPEVVANAVLRAAEHPIRDITIGGGGRLVRRVFDRQRSGIRAGEHTGHYYAAAAEGAKGRVKYRRHLMHSSAHTRAALSPGKALLAAGLGLAVYAGVRSLAKTGEH